MPVNENLNKILKEMWRIDDKSVSRDTLDDFERIFYNEHLEDIKDYYLKNSLYWNSKKEI
jgi:hypothetical protein